MLSIRRLSICFLLMLLLPVLSAHAAGIATAPGYLDPTFGQQGKILGPSGAANAVAIQPDGRILVAGSANGDFLVERLRPDGAPDPTFGQAGIVQTDFGGSEAANALVLQSDGKIVAGGASTDSGGDFLLARYLTDGKLDSGFGTAGKARADYGNDDTLAALALDPTGRIVAAGQTGPPMSPYDSFAIARFRPDGKLDTSFSADGMRTDGISSTNIAAAVAVQPDGKIVVAGWAISLGSGKAGGYVLARYTLDGSPDTSFAGNGLIWSIGGYSGLTSLLVQPDGKLVAAGTMVGYSLVVRYLPTGQPDSSFGTDGVARLDAAVVASFVAVARQRDGKLIALGRTAVSEQSDFALVRYRPNGSLDPTFGSAGVASTDFGGQDEGRALALQPNGRMVAAGVAGEQVALARYIGDTILFVPLIRRSKP